MTTDNKVLMKEGPWELRGYNRSNPPFLQSFIAHSCPGREMYYPGCEMYFWWDLKFINIPCYGCNKHPPKDMMTLWKLHNFDYIQAGR